MPLPPRQRPLLEDIERRILYSADTPAAALAATLPPPGAEAAQAQAATLAPTQAQVELVLLDARVADADLLLADIAAQVADGRQLEVLRVDADADGIAAIGAALAGREDVAALHIVSHGGAGEVLLGRDALDSDALLMRATDIAGWGSHLAAGADILLYGCDVAGNADGRALVQGLAALTGADVAASADRTGAATQGGNWTLEMQTGAIEAQLAFGLRTQALWQGVLATYTVTSTADAGAGTLRQAILDANANAGADTIVFNIAGAGLQTISPTSALPTITGVVAINGYTQSDAVANSASTGSNAVIRIALNGAGAGAGANGLNFGAGSAGSSVRGLAIGGFSGAGILSSVGGLTVAGNFIGTNAAGSAANANTTGISVAGTGATSIGSAALSDRNLVSGNTNNIVSSATGALTIQGNLVGTNTGGSTTIGTPTAGISISAGTANAVGGANAGEGNVIAGGARGVVVTNAGTLASVVGNTISQTTTLGIDLANNGVTANDAGDADTGPNALQNFPVITGAQTSANGYVAVQGTLNSTASSQYRIDFYASPSGTTIREGRVYLGYTTVTTDASGNVSFAASLRGSTVAVGGLVSATATRMSGTALAETSEFSAYQGTTAINVQTVTTTGFTGPGSLGAAIDAANAASGPTLIRFNIAGTGLHTITFPPHDPDNPQYYRIDKQVIIDGSTDDSFVANGNQPAIQIDASGGENVFALRSGADGSTIHGLALTNLYYTAIYIEPGSDNNVITGNYIGTIGAGGQMLSTSMDFGIWVDSASNNRIGGSTAADRNVFTGITAVAITVSADSGTATGNLVQGNYIGVMPNGLSAVNSPGQGIQVATATATDTRVLDNWIARTDYSAISVNAGATGTTVQGNRIGTDAAGTANWGVRLAAGIYLSGGAADNLFQNNVVAFSGVNGGILLAADTGTGNAILANQIYSNTGLGIDLGFNDVTANDTGDGDTGANNLQNYPVLTLARTNGSGTLELAGTLNSTANTYLRIELFANTANDSLGYGEGQTYLGFVNVLTDGSGNASFSTTLSATVAAGAFISATATRSNSGYTSFSDTSEFARSIVAISTVQNTLVVDTNADTVNGDTTSISTLLATKGADGLISLREALLAINNTPAGSLPTLVNFSIAGSGVHTITLGSLLPAITRPVLIDGTTDTASVTGNGGRPAIVVDGNGLSGSGLTLSSTAGGSTIRGLVIRNFGSAAINIEAGSDGNTIAGNYLGAVAATGNLAAAVNASYTVYIAGANNIIGGNTAADRNVLGTNGAGGVYGLIISGATANGNQILGNYIGIGADGVTAFSGAQAGLTVFDGASNRIEGNVIAADGDYGVYISTAGTGTVVHNNLIGTNAAGTAVVSAPTDGIRAAQAGANTVFTNNVIAGASLNGIRLDASASGVTVQGNRIGTDAAGTANWGVQNNGIQVASSNNLIGGTGAGQGNTIANSNQAASTYDGIAVSGGTGNAILGNRVYNTVAGTSGLGIDLGTSGATANDAGDADTGANNLQNFPVLTVVRSDVIGNLEISGTLNSTANSFFRIELFANTGNSASGYGEGRSYLGFVNVATDGAGNATFSTLLPATVAAGTFISATATRSNAAYNSFSDTSEFARNAVAISSTQAVLVVDTAGDTLDGDTTSISTLLATKGADGFISLREAIIAINNTPAGSLPTLVNFNISGDVVHTITLSTLLPYITKPVVIDGTTDTGSVTANGGRPAIVINVGGIAGDGLRLDGGSSGSTIRGLVIQNYASNNSASAIRIMSGSSGNTIVGNYLGAIGANGEQAVGMASGDDGIWIQSSNNTIGGSTAADRNVIGLDGTAAAFYAVLVESGNGNQILGNYAGVNASGTTGFTGKQSGIWINNASSANTRIENNLISGSGDTGIGISTTGTGTLVLNNRIGINAAGTGLISTTTPTGIIVYATGSGLQIIGNWIGSTTTAGMSLQGDGATVQGNRIGTDLAGTANWGGRQSGIRITGSNNLVGGTAPGQGNVIAFSNQTNTTADAISVASGTGNTILSNSIYGTNLSAGSLGIDLGASGVTANDPGDADTGANNLQNFPALALASTDGTGNITVAGTLNSEANSYYRIEVFSNTTLSVNGYGEGRTYLGFINVTTDSSGNASFSSTLSATVAVGAYISATATKSVAGYSSFSDTSEFAKTVVAISTTQNTLVVDTQLDTVDGDTTSLSTLLLSKGSDGFISLREALIAINNTPAGSLPTLVNFNIAGTGVHTITLGSELPAIIRPVLIDGTTDTASFSNNGNRPAIVLQGNGAGSNWVGLNFTGGSGGSTVRGLVIRGVDYAIRLQAGSDGNTIVGNYLGPLQADGSYTSAASAQTTWGVSLESANNTIGGTTAADRNVISGLLGAGAGVALQGGGATGNRVIGNYLGTNASGTPLGLGADGVYMRLGAHDNRIGGTAAGEGNLIAGAGQRGIWVDSSSGAGNAILGNSIHSNAGLGIDLGGTGVTANDTGDGDTGPNNLQNFPVLSSASLVSNLFYVAGSLNSEANKTYRIEFFGIPYGSTDGSGNGEGNVYLGFLDVTTDASGNATINATLTSGGLSYGAWITATATEKTGASSYGSTSEFAANVQAANTAPVLTVAANAAYTENAVAVALAPSATVVDTELAAAGNYAGATLTLQRNGGANAQDLFAATGGSLSALTQGGNLVYGGTTVGTVTTNSGGTLVLSFNGNATQTLVNNVLRAIGYANSSDDPPASVQLSWSFSDGNTGAQGGGGALAGTGSTTVSITAVNDAPVVTTSGGALAYTENAAATAIDTGLTVSDVDNATLVGATVSISANYVNGEDVLAFVNANGITGSWNAATGVLTLSGSATVANYQAALRSITYVNTSDNPSTATRTVSFVVSDGAANSTAATRSIAVTAVNDAPVLTTTGTALAYTENDAATAVDAGLSVSDADSSNLTGATVSISANYVNGQDVLAFTNQLGITGSWNAATGVLTLSGTTTVANYQTALRSITYVNTSENPSTATRTVSFTATDGALTSTAATRNITVTAVNDAPVLTTTGTTLGYTENAAAMAVDPGLSVSDVDSANLTGATVAITANYVNGEDVLAFTNANGITGSWNAATGVLTLSGSATVANYQAALRSVTYVNTSENPSTATRTVSFTATDGAATSAVATRNIAVTAVNDAPVVTATGTTLGYTENAAATPVDSGVTVSDVDNTTLAGATVTISANYVNGEDVLAFVNANGITGSWNAATGVLTLSGSATVANYQAALRSVTYVNTSDNPSTATRTVSFVVNDGTASSTAATRDITVTAVNDAPVVTTTGGTTAYTENMPATTIDPGLTVSDADNTTLAGATVTISANYVNGEDVLAFVSANGITGSWNAATGTLTLNGNATVANYQAALRSVTYANTSDNPSTATRTVSFVVNDGTANSAAATRDITVTAVNDAPVVTTTGGTTAYTENMPATAIDPGLTVSDADNTTLAGATVTISANYVNGQDVLAFVNANGITGSWDATTGTLTLSGSATVANYQAALRSITYVNTSDNPSTATRTVSFAVDDGSTNSTAATRDVSVTAVNDAPVVTTTGGTTAYTENAPATAIDPGLTVSDADNTTLSGATVTISANYVNGQDVLAFTNANGITGSWDATTGTLTLSGSATVANYQAALRSITYTNTSDNPSTATRTVSFVVSDGTATSTAATRDVSVAAVNDAPVVTTTGGTTAYTEKGPATAIDPGLTISDADNTTLAGATVTISANYVIGEDVLAFVNANGITGNWNAATGTLTLSGSSSIANYQAALRSITYANTSDNPSTAARTVSFTVSDGTATSTAATRDISVTAVNDAPVVTTTGGSTAYTENAAPTAIDTGLTVSDVDSANLTGATVTVSGNYANGEDVLAFVNQNGITGSWDAATGTLTLTGTASVANYQAALRSVTYANTSENPSTATRTVSFTVNDGSANSAAATHDVSVTAVNDAPVVTTTGGTTAYTEGAAPTAIDTGLTVSDADNTTLAGATVTISGNYVNGEDVLAFVNANGITGSWDAATGTLTLSGTASVAAYQAALRSITYANTGENPSTPTRTVSFVVNDGTANSTAATRDVSVTAVNDAPVVTTTAGTTAYTENAPATAIDPGLTVSDVDNATLAGATVTVSANYVNGEDVLAFVNANGITGSWNAATGTLTLSGTASVANYQAALRSITYVNTSDNPSTATRTVSFSATDGAATSTVATRNISVTAVNDAPVVTTTGTTLAYTENAAATAVDPGLTISDADNTNLSGATVSISANYVNGEDVLAFTNVNGITGSWDATTGTLTLSGSASVANYQAALRSITYANTSDNPSTATRTVSFVVNDGTANSTPATRDVSVAAVNDAPVVTTTGGTTTYSENAPATAIDPGVTVSDVDNTTLTGATASISANYANGQDVLGFVDQNGITGSWNAATGTLTLTGSSSLANYQAALRSITYTNTSDNPSTATRTVSFTVSDGTANSAAATRDVSVTAVNNAPVVTTTGGTTAYTENAAPTAVDTGLTVSDADNTTLAGATITIGANYANGEDMLAFVNANGITGSWDATTGTLTLSGSASVANYQAALRSITYVNTSDNPSTAARTVSFVVNDGAANSTAATRDVSVAAVNDAPVVTTTGGTTAYTENAAPTAIDPSLTVSDADNTTLTGATVNISGNYVNGQDVLAFVNANGITGNWDAATGTLTLSGSSSVANYQAALRSITYVNTSGNPSTATRTVSFVVNDGTANSATATRDVSVTAVNNAPVVTTTGGTTTYTENAPATAVDTGLTVSDADSTNLTGATVTISANYVNGQDVLAFVNANGITGSWDTTTGTLTLSGSASVANYQAALRSITYANTSDNPSTATRTVSFTVSDGTANSAAATRDISVTAVNNAPVVTTTAGTTAYTENAPATVVDTGLTVSDTDSTSLTGATASISANYANGQDVLGFVNQNGITGSWNAATGTLTLSGSATVANYQAALRSITYANTSNDPSTATRTVSFVVNDGTTNSAAATRTIAVTAVNNAPVITSNGGGATAAISIPENQTAVTTVTATDVDSPVLTYSISGGADAALFSIDANTGVLRFITAPNYEAPADAGGNNVYDVVVQVSDGSATATQAIAVTVTDVAEFGVGPVTDVDNAPNQVPENAPNGTPVGITAHATDPDVLDTVSYSLGNSAGGRFAIDAVTGVVTVANGSLLDYENATSHQITVVATSSDGSTSSANFTITLTDVNEAPVGPVTDVDPAPNQIPENAANGTAVGITAQAIDPDGTATVSYSLSDNAGGRFAINATTGVVTVANASLLDYETATSHQITVVATSSDNSTSSAIFTIAVTDVSETAVGPVTDVDAAPNKVPENAPNGTPVGITAHATDPDALDTVSYSLGNSAGGRFAIDAVTGVVTVADGSLLDYETATSHQITVVATSSDGSTSSASFTITLTDVNEAPVGPVTDVDPALNQVPENAANGTAVGITAQAVDPDGTATVSYSLSDNAGGRFAINATTGVVTVADGSLLDYETATSHQITVVATSSDNSTSSAIFTIAVTDVSETAIGPVSDVDSAPNTVPENAPNGTPVGITAHASDPDALDTVSYSLGNSAGGRFAIDPVTGVVTVADGTLLDYETATSHQITVIATSSDGSTSSANFTIALTDVNEAPVGPVTDGDAAANQVPENAANGTAVGITAQAIDPDGTATVSYSLSDNAGGRFTINATTGVVTVANASLLDHSANASHSITVLATSSDGSSTSASFSIAVLDAGGAAIGPISDTDADSNQVQQGAANGSTVGITALAVDPDGDSVAYSLTDDAGGRFTIDATTGVVTVADGSLLDAAVAASHAITVRATSADGSFSERTFSIAVLAAAGTGVGPVTDADPASNRVAENAANGTSVGITAQALDPDGDAVHYTLSDSAGGRFTIDATTGVVTVADGSRLDYEAATSHRITVLATSADGSTSSRDFTILLSDVNEFSVSPIIDVNGAPDQVRVPAANGTPVGITAFAQDRDGTDSVHYSLSDSAAGRFTINALTGVVTVADSARVGDATGYTITVRATSTDGSASERSFSIAVPNANVQPPAITSPDRVAVPENTSGPVLRVSASDPDSAADTLTYSIAGGADAARFTIDARTGELRFATPPDYEQPGDANADNRYEVRVRVSDGRQAAEQALTVEVTPVNDNVPRFTTPGGVVEVDENTVQVTQLQATDDDRPVETLHYSIVGGADAARFTIDAQTGVLRFVQAPDYEAPDDADGNGHYELVVAVSDGLHSSTLALTVRVRDVPDSPPVFPDSTQHVAVPEMQSEVTTVTATDPDNLVVRYSIAGGPDGALFAIDAESGRLWFLAPPQFQLPRDADGNNVYEVLVQASNAVASSTHTVLVTVLGSAVGAPSPAPVPTGPQPQPGTVAPTPVPTPAVQPPAVVQPGTPGTSGGGTHEAGGDYGGAGPSGTEGGHGQLPLGAPDPIYASRPPGTAAAPGLGLPSTLPPMARARPPQPHTAPEHPGEELSADLLKAPVLQPYVDVLVLPGIDARRTEVELVDVQVVATGAGDDANALREAQAGLDEALIGGVVISLGAAFWATRGGALLASLLTMSPAWVHMDPLPVLSRRRRAERKPLPPAALAADGPEHNGARPPQAVAEDKT